MACSVAGAFEPIDHDNMEAGLKQLGKLKSMTKSLLKGSSKEAIEEMKSLNHTEFAMAFEEFEKHYRAVKATMDYTMPTSAFVVIGVGLCGALSFIAWILSDDWRQAQLKKRAGYGPVATA